MARKINVESVERALDHHGIAYTKLEPDQWVKKPRFVIGDETFTLEETFGYTWGLADKERQLRPEIDLLLKAMNPPCTVHRVAGEPPVIEEGTIDYLTATAQPEALERYVRTGDDPTGGFARAYARVNSPDYPSNC
jgi:hypothetical protein